MEDRTEWVEWGSRRPRWRDRLPDRGPRRLTTLTVLVIGVVLGGSATSAVWLWVDRGSPPPPPRLTAEVLNLSRNESTGQLYVALSVTNQSQHRVRVNRLLTQGSGYVVFATSPVPPAVGGALWIAPGESGTVGMAVRGYCGPSRSTPYLTVLATVGERTGEASTVVVHMSQEARTLLSKRRSAYCERHAGAVTTARRDAP